MVSGRSSFLSSCNKDAMFTTMVGSPYYMAPEVAKQSTREYKKV